MHREVFALLYKDSKDAPPLLPTDTGKKKYLCKKIQKLIENYSQEMATNKTKHDWE